MPTAFLTKAGGVQRHRSSLLPCLMHTFKILLNLFPGILAVPAVHTLLQAGRVIFQKSLNLTRLVQADRQQQWELEVPVEPHTPPQEQTILTQTNQHGLGRQSLPTAHSRNLPPPRVLSSSAPSMKKKKQPLFLLQRLLCYIKM